MFRERDSLNICSYRFTLILWCLSNSISYTQTHLFDPDTIKVQIFDWSDERNKYMFIKVFTNPNEANNFIKTIKPLSVEYQKGLFRDKITVTYTKFSTVKEMRDKKIRDDEAEALVGLEEAYMQLEYLQTIEKLSDEDAKIVEGSIKGCKQNIKNYQAKLETIELWKSQ